MIKTPVSLRERLRRPDDFAAWSEFVHLYTPLLAAWAGRVGLRDEDAADLIQDVFVRLLGKLPQFTYDPSKSFRAWLKTVTLNQWRERLRRASPPTVGDAALAEVPDPAEAFWEADYRRHLVTEALGLVRREFTAQTWQAFEQTAVEGRSASQAGASLGMTAGAVPVARFRVLGRLRQVVEGLLDGEHFRAFL